MARNLKFRTFISTIVQAIPWTIVENRVILFQKFIMSRDKVSRRKIGRRAYKMYSDHSVHSFSI